MTAGWVPPRPYDAGPGSAPADSGPTLSRPNWSVWAIDPPPAPISTRSIDGTDTGKPGALLEPVDAGDLERRRQARLAVLDEAGLGRRAAHVEAQQPVLAEALGEPAAGEGTGGRAGLDETDRGAGGVVGGHDTAVGQHHQHGAAEPLGGQPLLQLVEVRADHRHRRRVACRGHHARVLAQLRRHVGGDADGNGELGAQVFGDAPLVVGVDVGVEQADADGLDVGSDDRRGQGGEVGAARRLVHRPRGEHPLGDLEREVAGDRRGRELDLQVVHVVAMLVADQQRVAEALRGHQRGAPCLAFDEGVGDERRGVDDRRGDVRRADAGAGGAAG